MGISDRSAVRSEPLLDQSRLDLQARQRTSLYPWRGQFSPELIDNLLARYAQAGDVVLDPFAGSGTVLFEAARHGLDAYALEINPVAALFCRMASFCALGPDDRTTRLSRLDGYLQRTFGGGWLQQSGADALPALQQSLRTLDPGSLEYATLATSALLAMKDSAALEYGALASLYAQNSQLVRDLPVSSGSYTTYMADARKIPLPDRSIDIVMTSPPYINVFNYHQHYRKAVEALGWLPLAIARSEIGANRKYRQNRLKTVVQYCIDMWRALGEIQRVLAANGRAVVVVGYESRVRGLAFYNAALLTSLAPIAGLEVAATQQRRFVSRFGTPVREDLLVLRTGTATAGDVAAARSIGVAALRNALPAARDEAIRTDLEEAIDAAEAVEASPLADFGRATPMQQIMLM